ncbi:hypothetical protein AU252_18265 [Pseudarthrobacter sulfonivorans]|uniref:Transposase n=1 Tax=Pseudarthrobacter sulfonivorans TaxID=121292 RepID=A0A0U3R155_9MICC|nr:DUF6262 family protein [Pseudarthrobacter sulfonivorans]ALV42860.1 hypothetical protein AU252_18265 [Pseudarthrobacter sulfonivorans]
MNEQRTAAIDKLIAAKKKESKAKHASVRKAIAKLLAGPELLTVSSVARNAGVSRWLLYNTPDLKTAIATASSQQRKAWAQGSHEAGLTPRDATTELLRLQNRLDTVTRQRDDYKRAVHINLAEELAGRTPDQMAAYIKELEEELIAEREHRAQTESAVTVLEASLQDLDDQLRAAQSINRTMMKQRNETANVLEFAAPATPDKT